jgi:hypothetical protein
MQSHVATGARFADLFWHVIGTMRHPPRLTTMRREDEVPTLGDAPSSLPRDPGPEEGPAGGGKIDLMIWQLRKLV